MGIRIEPQIPFGRAVQRVREDRKLDRSTVAARGGVSTRWLRDVEAGKCNPTLANIQRVANGLGVGLTDLMEELERSERGSSKARAFGVKGGPWVHTRP